MGEATNRVPRSLNPYVKLYKINIDDHKLLNNNCVDHVALENQSNQLIEYTQTLQVVLKRMKIYECEQCYLCYTTERDYRLHLLKHAAPVVHTEYSYGKYVKRYKCEDCDLKFVAASTLEAHSAVHRPYSHICHCGVGFHIKNDLSAHKKLVHQEIIDKQDWQAHTTYSGKKEKSAFCIKAESVSQQSNAIKTKLGVYKPKPVNEIIKKKKKVRSKKNKTGIKRKPRLVALPDVEKKTVCVDGVIKYMCPLCKKKLSSYSCLKLHYVSHTGVRPYKCDKCDRSFSQNGPLNMHKQRVHEGVTTKVQCTVCSKYLGCYSALMLHMRIHTGEKPYECDFCGKRFADPSAFGRHGRTHTGDKRYHCTECPMRFSDASGLIVHRKRHTGQRDNKCDLCEKTFYTKSDLRIHVMARHVIAYKYVCDDCGKRFTRKDYLRGHILRSGVHSSYNCNLCPRKFYTEAARNKHIKIHAHIDTDDYKCDCCGALFGSKGSIAKHLKTEHDM